MVRPIVNIPNPILTTPSQPVVVFDEALKKLADDMIETMRQARGVGLAASQVGQGLRLIVVEYNPSQDEKPRGSKIPLTILANSRIVHFSNDHETRLEGCLSIPNVELPIKRSKRVKVISQNLLGDRVKIYASGFFARILQHEVDHVNGILITDRVIKVNKNNHGI